MKRKQNSKGGANAPTNAPTNAPANAPANAPTNAPVNAPVNAPANAPVNTGNNKKTNTQGNNKNANKAMNVVNNSNTSKNIADKMGNMVNSAANTIKGSMNNIGKKYNNIPSASNLQKKTSAAVGSIEVSSVNKYLMILLIGVFFILIIIFAKYILVKLYDSTDTEPYLIKGTKSAQHTIVIHQNPDSVNYIPILRSENKSGMEFSYSFWILIMDMNTVNKGKWKHVFHKGNATSYPNRAPGVWLGPSKNTMRIYMNTFTCPLGQYMDIENIPIKKWFCCQIVLQNINSHSENPDKMELDDLIRKDQDHIIDFYMNGQLKQSQTIKGIPKQNNGDLWINKFGGFNGYLSKLRYYARALKFDEIQNIVKQGPASIVTADTGELPPYLDDSWWHNKLDYDKN